MPDRLCWTHFLTLGGIAGFISLGSILKEKHMISFRAAVGRVMCSMGLGGSAAFLGFISPEVSMTVQMGLACGLATLGTDVVTAIVRKRTGVEHE
jgi:hypothetical protein